MRIPRNAILMGLLVMAPLISMRAQITETYTYTTNRPVPDGDPSGLSDVRAISSSIASITSVTVGLKIAGNFNGDLYGYVTQSSGFAVLLNRPGRTAANPFGYADSGLNVVFQDGAPNGDIHLYESNTIPAPGSPLTGIWQPDGRNVDPSVVLDTSPRSTALANFNGLNASGTWTLFLADLESGGTNELAQWSLTIVGQAYPTLTWATPSNIVYGTALGAAQLNATATFHSTNVPGTYTYTNAPGMVLNAGTVLEAGSGQTLYVTFTPDNSATFLPVTASVLLNVTAVPLSVTSCLSANNKVYDGTTNATITVNNTLPPGVLAGDAANVALSTNGCVAAFASPNAANGIAVTVSGLTLTGSAANNYTLTPPSLAANISPKALTVSGLTAGNTIYDGTTTAKLGGAAVFPAAEAPGAGSSTDGRPYSVDSVSAGGTPTGTLAAKDARLEAVTITGVTVTGPGNGNYTVTQQTGLTQNVTAKALTMSGLTVASSKVYDGTTSAAVSGTPALQTAEAPGAGSTSDGNPYSGDSVSLTGTATGTYNSANVATASSVSYGGLSLSGAQAVDYSLTMQSPTPATITPAATTGTFAASANPALVGQSVTFTLTLSSSAPGVNTLSNNVNFRINGSIGGTAALSGGQAIFASNSLPLGTNSVTAEYAGDVNFIGVTNTLAPGEIILSLPVAGNVTIQRYPSTGARVSLATLLASCSDADGDALTISVSSTSTNGGSIMVLDGWANYTPVPGFTNVDSFTYTANDPFGNSAAGTVTVAIQADNSPGQNLIITSLGNGAIAIAGSGIPGYTYGLQFTPTLNPPNWQNLPQANVTADSTGAFQYTNTPEGGMGFYRTVYP